MAANEQHLLDTYFHEYEKHQDEIQARIEIQNSMAERAISITVLLASVLGGLFTFFMKDVAADTVGERLDYFAAVCIPVILVHGVLTQFTLAAWIYQVSMIFRLVRYWSWTAQNKIDPIIHSNGDAFLWDRSAAPPWDINVDKRFVRYFQPLLVYGLCAFVLLCLPLSLLWSPHALSLVVIRRVGICGSVALIVTLSFLIYVHFRIHRKTDDFRRSLPLNTTAAAAANATSKKPHLLLQPWFLAITAVVLLCFALLPVWRFLTIHPLRLALPWSATVLQDNYREVFPDYSYCLKATMDEGAFDRYCTRLRLTPRAADPRHADTIFWFHWNDIGDGGEPMDWWDPPHGMDGVFMRHEGHYWTFAKYVDGLVYVKSISH